MSINLPEVQGLVQTVQTSVASAFELLVDFQQSITIERYQQAESKNYNPATGALAQYAPAREVVVGLVLDYEASKVDEEIILRTDQQVLIERSKVNVSGNGEISTRDRLRVGTSLLKIVDVSVDPAGALYTLQVREGSG